MTQEPGTAEGEAAAPETAAQARERDARRGVFGYFVRHGTAANLLLLAMVLVGALGANQIRVQLWPDIVVDVVRVTVAWPGAGPDEVDRAVVQALEPGLLAVDGLDTLKSVAKERRADLTLEFLPGTDMLAAVEEVDAAVAAAVLPRDADPPKIRRRPWTGKVTDVVIHGPVPHAQLKLYAYELQDALRRRGVTRVTVGGVPGPLVRVLAWEAELMRHDLTLDRIVRAVSDAAATDPGGNTRDGRSRVRSGAESRSPEAVGEVVVLTRDDGAKIRVRDLAEIEEAGAERGARYYVGGNDAILLRVDRGAEGDTIEVHDKVRTAARALQRTLPEGVQVELVHTWAHLIEARLALLLDNAALGLGLVLLLLFLFLNARTAVWVAAGIPAALLAALGMMWLLGVTLNMVSVFALIVVLGMVVDNAIVVGEHADALGRQGLSPAAAATGAARRMASPVFSACVTTVIAFSAMYLIGGRFGTMISDIPTTVSIVLIASLAECFLVLPNHMRHAVAGAGRRRWYDAPSRAVNRGFDAFKARAFRPFMRGVIRLRYPVLGGAVLLLALSVELVVNRDVAWRFWSAPERGSFVGNVAMMAGAQREDTLAQAALLEDAVREVGAQLEAEHGRNPIVFTLTQVGGNAGRGLSIAEDREKYQLASVSVELIDAEERPYSSYEVARMVQDRVRRHPLAEVVAFRGDRAGPGGDSLSVRLFGSDAETLKAASETFKRMASAIPEVTGLEDTLAFDKTELTLELTPLGRALGFTPEDLGDVLFNRLSGKEAAEFPVDRQTGRIVVILHRLDRTSDYLERARLRAPNGSWATLSEIVDMTASPGFSTLRREDGRLTVSVSGEIVTEDPLRLEAIERALEEEILPAMAERHAVEYVLSGLKEQERQFLGEAQYGMWAGLAGIYVALAWVFASWTRPLAVLLAVPFGLIGAIWGHLWWDVSMSMFSIVGLIGMIGIIINDSIVLVTTIDEYAARRGMKPAVLDAVCDRLRPVLLTTLTTVFGLMPMLYESSQQAQFLKPTIITLAYGLGFGMVIVLLVTPALAMMQRDVAAALTSARRMGRLALRRRKGLGGGRGARAATGASQA